MRIGHTIVALNLPSASMLRGVTALSRRPLPSHPIPPRYCESLREESGWGCGEANRVAIIHSTGRGGGGLTRHSGRGGKPEEAPVKDDIKWALLTLMPRHTCVRTRTHVQTHTRAAPSPSLVPRGTPHLLWPELSSLSSRGRLCSKCGAEWQ